MTHTLCPRCRLRFTPAASAYLLTCPACGGPAETAGSERAIGCRLFEQVTIVDLLPAAIAAALAPSELGPHQPS